MKSALMRGCAAAVLVLAGAAAATASPIAAGSSIDISGGVTTVPNSAPVDLATALTFQSVVTGMAGSATGSFAGLFSPATPGTISGTNLNLAIGPQAIVPIFQFLLRRHDLEL